MGVAVYNPDTGTWDTDEGTNGEFNQRSGWDRNRPEMGYEQPRQRPELDPRNYPGVEPGLQIITPTTDKEKGRNGWQPNWKIDDSITDGRLPSITPEKKPFLN